MDSNRIPSIPPSMFYFADFITEEEAQAVLHQIPSHRWIALTHRRLQALPARLTASNTLVTATSLPDWLSKPIVERIHRLGVFSAAPHGINHCLINEYLPGQGIMPHEDGAAYYPAVATVSLGGALVLEVVGKESQAGERKQSWRVLQEPRSLLVTTGQAYTDTLHGIAEVEVDHNLNAETVANWNLLGDRSKLEANAGVNERAKRISLTYRDVKRVSSLGNMIFGKPRTLSGTRS